MDLDCHLRNKYLFLYVINYPLYFFQISFMIRPRNAGRIEIPIVILLALVNMFMSIRTDSPTSSSDKVSAIGLWMIICLIFVILCLLEYGTILCMEYLSSTNYSDEAFKSFARKMDLISLKMSLLVFLVFNLAYWCIIFLPKV